MANFYLKDSPDSQICHITLNWNQSLLQELSLKLLYGVIFHSLQSVIPCLLCNGPFSIKWLLLLRATMNFKIWLQSLCIILLKWIRFAIQLFIIIQKLGFLDKWKCFKKTYLTFMESFCTFLRISTVIEFNKLSLNIRNAICLIIFLKTGHALVIIIIKKVYPGARSSSDVYVCKTTNFNSAFFLLQMTWFVFHIHENGFLVEPLLKPPLVSWLIENRSSWSF